MVEETNDQPRSTCKQCHRPFDPTDKRWDGRAEYGDSGACRSCVDRCHESTDAFHICAVCTAPN
ncbi:hypothetical protein GCM10010420_07330 [Streptomyces glaucosporus]|uniref:Small CPxCG-related zinc finger protein n=1 Tax=Streptomyces glaucosporus TaxID=284044 RepID=A0ABP5UTI5_9ACTN